MVYHVDGRMRPHGADNQARVYEDKHGNLWVTHQELMDCGYRGLEDFDIVWINGSFYELQAHLKEANAWWIEEITWETTEEETESPPETTQGEQT